MQFPSGEALTTTVACVFVKGHVPFTVEYVTRLAAMVERWMDRPYTFVCLTDRPEQVPQGIATIPIPNLRPLWGWWSKLELFNKAHGFDGRMLYLDLDTLIVAPLAPILDFPSPFALIPHAGNFEGFNIRRNRRRLVKRFNSSVMVWDARKGISMASPLYDRWTPAVAADLHGDQDFLAENLPKANKLKLEWFPRLSELGGQPPNSDAIVVLSKCPKNHEAARLYPWFRDIWEAA